MATGPCAALGPCAGRQRRHRHRAGRGPPLPEALLGHALPRRPAPAGRGGSAPTAHPGRCRAAGGGGRRVSLMWTAASATVTVLTLLVLITRLLVVVYRDDGQLPRFVNVGSLVLVLVFAAIMLLRLGAAA